MKRIKPADIYRELPCSAVALGCALGITNRSFTKRLISQEIKSDGYLSLAAMNRLIRQNIGVRRHYNYKRGHRLTLREYAHCPDCQNPAIICVSGHYIYYDGKDYYSFFLNDGDEVISVWELQKKSCFL